MPLVIREVSVGAGREIHYLFTLIFVALCNSRNNNTDNDVTLNEIIGGNNEVDLIWESTESSTN